MRADAVGPLGRLRHRWRRYLRGFRAQFAPEPRKHRFEQPKLWLISLAVGVAVGYAVLLFVLVIEALNTVVFGGGEARLATAAASAPVWVLLLAPIVAGALVGLLLRVLGREASALGVADVMEGRAVGEGRIRPRDGVVSAIAAALSLGGGASAGREGPAVVLGAAVSSFAAHKLNISPAASRTVLGCAAAAAVSASFNAPIAGALFALEVVLGHYAVRAFAPITIASVAGAVISRTYLGETPAFSLPPTTFGTYTQFPAFFLLGLVSAVVAVTMMLSIFVAKDVMDGLRRRLKAPVWTQPMIAGALLGLIAAAFPQVLGVGYQTASDALAGRLTLQTCVMIAVVKTVAVAVTLGGRFAGGVFSPALMIGALTGAAFGVVALEIFPEGAVDAVVGSQNLYALAGMGAVAGAVLGAPISTTLIVFELTRDYGTAIAVMVSTSVATVATQQMVGKSFFHMQLARRKIDLYRQPKTFLLPQLQVRSVMRLRGAEDGATDTASWALIEQGAWVDVDASLAKAFPMFRNGRLPYLPVVSRRVEGQGKTLVGAIFYVDALRAYNRALVENHSEEHS